MTARAFAARLAGGVLFSVAALSAEGPIPEGRPPEWGVAAGYGWPLPIGPGDSTEHQFVFSPSVGFRLSSRLEYVAAATFERYFTPTGYFVGVLPGGLRLAIGGEPGAALQPYAVLGLGFGWTDLQVEEISRRFNFRIEAGVGLRGRPGGKAEDSSAWTLEARYAHTSNAGTSLPNYGLNSLVVLAGWRFR